ncbi:MAG: hypothetical protein J6Q85_07865 [Clostridia bacterium]|nr:hypothetical protein [Clostridia bacterium]
MKKALQVISCATGGAMIGFYANQLNTLTGGVCFTIGVVLLVVSIVINSKNKNNDVT